MSPGYQQMEKEIEEGLESKGFFGDPGDDLQDEALKRNEELAKGFANAGPTNHDLRHKADFSEDFFKTPLEPGTAKSLSELEEWKQRYFGILEILNTFKENK